MKRYEERETKPRVERVCVETTCDLCGAKAREIRVFGDDRRRSSEEWEMGAYDVRRTTIECAVGDSYSDSGNTETTSFDVCPDCFLGKLVPWMAAQGASPTTERTDW